MESGAPAAVRETGAPVKSGRARKSRFDWYALLVLPTLLVFAAFFLAPLGLMLVSSLTDNKDGAITLAHYSRFFSSGQNLQSLYQTLKIGALSALVSLVIGYPVALWLVRCRSAVGRILITMAVLAPMLTGIVERTFSWIVILQDTGLINNLLVYLGIIGKPVKLMYNELGTIIVLVHIYTPYMILTLTGAIGRIDTAYEQAAQSLGATPFRSFIETTLPLSLPGILAGSLLVFALGVSAYVTPKLMGGGQVMTLPMLIYQQVSTVFNPGFAGAAGVVLLIVALAVIIPQNYLLKPRAGV
jgi:putative spermidine/putrescine transport system permease protein